MSYNVWAVIDTGGPEPAGVGTSLNHTSNCSGMWNKAMPSINLKDMDGKTCAECIPHLRDGIRNMEDNIKDYNSMNPPNGWGSATSALKFLREILQLCLDHPKATLRVHC